jgi:aminoglycoside phosphotransferase (APT) family kinase protein
VADLRGAGIAALVGSAAEVVPLSGGYSGETFLVTSAGDQAVLRLYARRPERAGIDQALLERVRGLVPVPRVLEAAPVAGGPGRPPFLLLEALPGDRLDLVLPAADAPLRRRLGEAVAGVLVLLATERMPRAGTFVDATLDPAPFPPAAGDAVSWLATHAGESWFAALPAADQDALRRVARRAAALTRRRPGRTALVHADFNPKNLLVDPATGGVTGVVDWEFAYAGSPLGDVGNLLRFEADPDFTHTVAESYSCRAPDVPEDWVEVARALDLFALVELAARRTASPVVDAARTLLQATARTGTLAADRADPTTL